MRPSRAPLAVPFCLLLVLPLFLGETSSQAEEKPVWDERDTALANHYIASLQKKPEYGPVLDLLWDHYDSHGQADLLLAFFRQASQRPDAVIPKLILGHLHRKMGQDREALVSYREAELLRPNDWRIQQALGELHLEQDRPAPALAKFTAAARALSPQATEWLHIQQSRLQLLQESAPVSSVVALAQEMLAEHPQDTQLRRTLVPVFLSCDDRQSARENLQILARHPDAEVRLEAAPDLGKLYELDGDFNLAESLYQSVLSSLHFQHHLYVPFLTRLIRLQEQTGGLASWIGAQEERVTEKSASEAELLNLVRIHRILGRPLEEEKWLERLCVRLPDNLDYRLSLVELRLSNGRHEEAGTALHELLIRLESIPLSLVLLQADIMISLHGTLAAEEKLLDFLSKNKLSVPDLEDLLRYAENNQCDQLAQHLYQQQRLEGWGDSSSEPEVRLARFHHRRGRPEEAAAILRRYVEEAEGSTERHHRESVAMQSFFDLDLLSEARAMARRQETRSSHLILGEISARNDDVTSAIFHFNQAWHLASTLPEKNRIDERLFTLLRAMGKDPGPESGLQGRLSSESNEGWEELTNYYRNLRRDIRNTEDNHLRYRAAWWAIRLTDYDEAYRLISPLHDPKDPNPAFEELLLELARQTGNEALVIRQLTLLAKLQPERREEVQIRKAELRLHLNFEDEAIRSLRRIVSRPDASLKAVESLAKAYESMGRLLAVEELWREAFQTADLLERRQILEPFTRILVQRDQIDEALALYGELRDSELDRAFQRQLFQDQVNLAQIHDRLQSWMLPQYETLCRREPLDAQHHEFKALIHHRLDQHDAAFRSLRRAHYLSERPGHLLQSLPTFAQLAGDLKSAIYFQRQFLFSSGPDASPAQWIDLVHLLEGNLEVARAEELRIDLEQRFAQSAPSLQALYQEAESSQRWNAARRILERILVLRPGDVPSHFALARLHLRQGSEAGAREHFLAVLQSPRPVPSSDEMRFPILSTRQVGLLQRFVPSASTAPGLPSDVCETLAAWLESAHPEFQPHPVSASALRLRALEELAHLSSGDPELASLPLRSPEEELWRSAYTGSDLTISFPQTENIAAAFPSVVLALRHHRLTDIENWVADSPPRHHLVLLAIRLLLLDPEADLSRNTLQTLFSLLQVPEQSIRESALGLVQDDALPAAYRLVEAAALRRFETSFFLARDLASLARQLGRPDRYRFWVGRAFDHLSFDRNLYPTLTPFELYSAISDAARLAPDAESLLELFAHCEAKRDQAPLSKQEELESDFWMALAFQQDQRALDQLEELSESLLAAGPADVELWIRLENLFTAAADRTSRPRALYSLAEQILGSITASGLPLPEEVSAQMDQFHIRVLLVLLEALPPRERGDQIAAFLSLRSDPVLWQELASSLESSGLGLRALPLYRALVGIDPERTSMVRGYLTACRLNGAYEEARDFLRRAITSGPPVLEEAELRSQGYLHRNYARFLLLSGDIDALRALANGEPQQAEHSFPVFPSLTALYQQILLQHFLEQGDDELALEIQRQIPDSAPLPFNLQLETLQLFARNGHFEEAIAHLETTPLPSSPAQLATRVQTTLASLQAGSEDSPSLIAMARRVSTNSEASLPLIQTVARLLAESGEPGLAQDFLHLNAYRQSSAHDRFRLLLQQARLALSHPEAEAPVHRARLIDRLIASWPSTSASARELLNLVAATRTVAGSEWESALESAAGSEEHQILSLLGLALLHQSPMPEENLARIVEDPHRSREELRLVAGFLVDQKQPDAAERVLNALHDRHSYHPLEDLRLSLRIQVTAQNEAAIRQQQQQVLRLSLPSLAVPDVANSFVSAGHSALALPIVEAALQRKRRFQVSDVPLLVAHFRILLSLEEYDRARDQLQQLYRRFPSISLNPLQQWLALQPGTDLESFQLPAPQREKLTRH